MKFIKALTIFTVIGITTAGLAGCATSQNNKPLDTANISEYGPKTFNENYKDETQKIQSLDAPFADTLDEVKPEQYVLVTLDNDVLRGKNYQTLYKGNDKTVVEITKAEALKLKEADPNTIIETNFEVKIAEEEIASPYSVQSGTSLDAWGLDRIDSQKWDLNDSYTYNSDGTGVTAYIVDSGIKSSHIEFTGRIPKGFDTVLDGNGYEDCMGHGTHVAGTIGGTQYGVAKNVALVPVRVFGCDGGASSTSIYAGMDWIKANHSGGPAVVNLSLGSDGVSDAWRYIVDDMVQNGFVMVIAAGNSSIEACKASPAFVPSAITVGASNGFDSFASFSNYGACVDLVAPGEGIMSSYIGSNAAVAALSGTSMATPHVTGAIARLLQVQPTYTPAEAEGAIVGMASQGNLYELPEGTPNKLLYLDKDLGLKDVVTVRDDLAMSPKIVAVKVMNVASLPVAHVYAESSVGIISNYTAYIALAGSNTVLTTVKVTRIDPTKMLDITINGLTKNETYDVWITADNGNGASKDYVRYTFKAVY